MNEKAINQACNSYPQLIEDGIDAYRKYVDVCHSIVQNLQVDFDLTCYEHEFEQHIKNEALVINEWK